MARLIQALIALTAAATAGAAPAPQVSPGRINPQKDLEFQAPQGTVYFDTDADGAHWVMGDTYKAKVSGNGFTYIPFLGSDAPRTYPVEMRLARASAGRTDLELPSRGTVTRTGDRFVIDRGPVQVIYDVAAEGVEQSFLFDERLSGELELEVAMSSDMPAQADGPEFRWASPLGGMIYGEAVALDESGAETAVSSRLIECPGEPMGTVRVRHRVSADFVRTASGPVLVDPWIYTYAFGTSSKFLDRPVVVYDKNLDAYMIVLEEAFAANDRDIRKLHVSAVTGTAVSSPSYLDFTSLDARYPSIAHTVAPNMFLVAVVQRYDGGERSRVIGRRVAGNGTTAGFWRTLADAPNSDTGSFAPRLGGDNGPSGTNHFGLLSLMRDGAYTEVQFHRISSVDGTPIPNSERRLIRKVSSTLESAEMSSTTGDPSGDREWVIALMRNNSSPNLMRIQTIRINHLGNVVQSVSTVASGNYVGDDPSLQVSALGSKRSPTTGKPYYLVTYIDNEGPGIEGAGTAVLCSGRRGLDSKRLRDILHQRGAAGFIGFMRTRATRHGWMITHGYNGSTPTTKGMRLTTLSPVNDKLGAIDRRHLIDTGEGGFNFKTAATTFEGGNQLYSDGIAVWTEIIGPGFDERIEGSIIFGLNQQAAGSQYCFGTPNSTLEYGFIRAVGTASRLSPKALQASGLPPSEWAYFLASPTQDYVPAGWGGAGTLCLQAPRYVTGSIQRVSDAGTIDFSLQPTQLPTASGPTAAMAGDSWHCQAWHVGSGTSNFTNALTITFD